MRHTLAQWCDDKKKELLAAGFPVKKAMPQPAAQPMAMTPPGQPMAQPMAPPPAIPMPGIGKAPTLPPPPKDKASKNSPGGKAAQHVAQHVQDPLGSTQDMFQDLGQKKLEYQTAQENARRQLLPVQSVLDHVNQTHNLNPDEAMGWQDPNDPNSQNNQPGNMPNGANQTGDGPVPPNMAQTPGQMNTARPSQSGFGPGKSPGQQQNVRPAKQGIPQPGGGGGNPANPSAKPKPGGAAKKSGASKTSGKKIRLSIESGGPGSGPRPGYGVNKRDPQARPMFDKGTGRIELPLTDKEKQAADTYKRNRGLQGAAQSNDHGIRPRITPLTTLMATADLNCFSMGPGGMGQRPGGGGVARSGGGMGVARGPSMPTGGSGGGMARPIASPMRPGGMRSAKKKKMKAWSDESRQAAADARRRQGGSRINYRPGYSARPAAPSPTNDKTPGQAGRYRVTPRDEMRRRGSW